MHTCNDCDIPIFPGDPYCANIWVINGKIWVEKFHNGCPALDPEQEEMEKRSTQTKKKRLAIAA
jgi:hypothetical protein